MINCIDDNILVEFVEGLLSPDAVAGVESHLSRCISCRRRVALVGTSPSRLAEAPTAPAGIGAHLTLKPGTRVDRFEVRHEIGRGGMGIVFSARDPQLERSVALKLLHSASTSVERAAQAQARLLEEARMMARLDHPNIVTVYEVGTYCHETYIVMELIPGETLNQWLRRWNRPWSSIVDAFRQAGRALAHAHDHQLAHGDFKPENVLIDERDRARVTDFGLSRPFEIAPEAAAGSSPGPDGEARRTVMGTPRYMAPEQFAGRPADARSDQFGFCVALYEALYGRHPFAHDTALSVLKLPHEQAFAPMLDDAANDEEIPAWLHNAVVKGLEPNPRNRYRCMRELIDALRPPVRRDSRRRLVALVAAAMTVVCLLGYAMGAWRASPADPTSPALVEGAASASRRGAGASGAAAPATSPNPVAPAARPDLGSDLGSDLASDFGPDSRLDPAAGSATSQPIPEYGAEHGGSPLISGVARVLFDLVGDEIERSEKRLELLRRFHDTMAGLIQGDRVALGEVIESDGDDATSGDDASGEEPVTRSPSRNGLGRAAITRAIGKRWRELEVCFGEWRERQPDGRSTLTAHVLIDRRGRARVPRLRGLRDKVVRKCVSGVITAVQFPGSQHATAVELRFRSVGTSLDMATRLSR